MPDNHTQDMLFELNVADMKPALIDSIINGKATFTIQPMRQWVGQKNVGNGVHELLINSVVAGRFSYYTDAAQYIERVVNEVN